MIFRKILCSVVFLALSAIAPKADVGALSQRELSVFLGERSVAARMSPIYFESLRALGLSIGQLLATRKGVVNPEEAIAQAERALENSDHAAERLAAIRAEVKFTETSNSEFNEMLQQARELFDRMAPTIRTLRTTAKEGIGFVQSNDHDGLQALSETFASLALEQNNFEILTMRMERLTVDPNSPYKGLALAFIGSLDGLNAFAKVSAAGQTGRLKALLKLPDDLRKAVSEINAGIEEAVSSLRLLEERRDAISEGEISGGASKNTVLKFLRDQIAAYQVQIDVEREMANLFQNAQTAAEARAAGDRSQKVNETFLQFDGRYAEIVSRRLAANLHRQKVEQMLRDAEH